MWSVQPYQIAQSMRTPGGTDFAAMVDSILRAQAATGGIPDSEILTNLKNVSDGGVDTRLSIGSPHDASGWVSHPTIWQYKATSAEGLGREYFRGEIRKQYAMQRILDGHAYRFCICDSIPDSKRTDIEAIINEIIQGINPDAPQGRLVTADDLAVWIRKFPAVVMRHFRPSVATLGIHLEAWGKNVTSSTQQYVPVNEWQPVMESLKKHVTIEINPPNVVFTIQGEAGVGKTRLAYEALRQVSGASSLVIYTEDEQGALALAKSLANDLTTSAILVADECRVQTRAKLQGLLQGHSNRVRIVAIDNAGTLDASPSVTYMLKRMTKEALALVLETNYPNVPSERRRAYARLAGGFVRLAADMCDNDALVSAAGSTEPLMPSLKAYMATRLSDDALASLQALSLVTRVGFKDDVGGELDELANLVDISRTALQATANRLHDVPGFVARGGRYFYVTPEAVAQAAFSGAWGRWAEGDQQSFLGRVPFGLLEQFMERVAHSATKEVRSLVGEFFRQFVDDMQPESLVSTEVAKKLVSLVETDPEVFWPSLRRKIDNLSVDQLSLIKGDGEIGWGPRRHLVWLAERMAALPSFFVHTEQILLRLALAETEPGLANNASSIWRQIFRIWLSGTPVPFQSRLETLKARLESEDNRVQALAIDAFSELFDFHVVRVASPEFTGGQLVPSEWQPADSKAHRACLRDSLRVLDSERLSDTVRRRARMAVAGHVRELLQNGMLNELRSLFRREGIVAQERIRLVEGVDEYCRYELAVSPPDYARAVAAWQSELTSVGRHDKLRLAVGMSPWHGAIVDKEDAWRRELKELAAQLMHDCIWFRDELPWLVSEEALGSNGLGFELGRVDRDGSYLRELINACETFESTNLTRGYIQGLLEASPGLSREVNRHIDVLQQIKPVMAFDLFTVGGEMTRSFERAISLVDRGALPVTSLTAFIHGIGRKELNPEEYHALFSRVISGVSDGVTGAAKAAFQFAAKALHDKRILEDPGNVSLLWLLCERENSAGGTDLYWWGESLKYLSGYDTGRVAGICSRALVGNEVASRNVAAEIMEWVAKRDPGAVMAQLGSCIMDPERGWHFAVGRHASLLQSIPTVYVVKWLNKAGTEGARRLAGHLPAPFLASDGTPTVPELTEYVLHTFGSDETVFRQFCAGVHNFQLYEGDIAQAHRDDAALARRFKDHPSRRIREWAAIEESSALKEAELWQQEEDETDLK